MSSSENNNKQSVKENAEYDANIANQNALAVLTTIDTSDESSKENMNVHENSAMQMSTAETTEENFTNETRLISNSNDKIKEDSNSIICGQESICQSQQQSDEKARIISPSSDKQLIGGASAHGRCNQSRNRNILLITKNDPISASDSLNMKKLDAAILPRRVSFPNDSELVTGYLEPANPWEQAFAIKSVAEVIDLYVRSCQKHETTPLQTILDHLKAIEFSQPSRHPMLTLKSIQLAPSDCEALEEIFKRVQYKSIDLSACDLEENAASALFDMMEYYEAANELDISYNAKGMTQRGWSSCTYMVSHSQALQVLVAHGNPISKTNAETLGHALTTCNLHTLKLEHCGLKGQPLKGLCTKLRQNKVLRELWLAYNDLDYLDADTIAELLKVNHYIELIDISNNNIKDEGLQLIVQALIIQAIELERRSTFQRSAAIDDDCETEESLKIVNQDSNMLNDDIVETNTAANIKNLEQKDNNLLDFNTDLLYNVQSPSSTIEMTKSSTATHEEDGNENHNNQNAENTIKSNTTKNSTQTGQSMLDKLLSMGDSINDDGTQTAGSCFNDMIIVSDYNLDTKSDISIGESTLTSAAELPQSDSVLKMITESVLNSSINTECTTTTPKCVKHIDNIILEEFVTEAIIKSDNKCNSRNTNNNVKNEENEASGMNNNSDDVKQSEDKFHEKIPIEFDKNVLENAGIFEIMTSDQQFILTDTKAAQNNIFLNHTTKAVDVNKNTKVINEDYDDTHSTDSAFESASEGDISRHLSDEFSRISTLFESGHVDDLINKQLPIETATIATETAECLLEVDITPTSTPCNADEINSVGFAAAHFSTTTDNKHCATIVESPVNSANDNSNTTTVKVTIDTKNLVSNKKETNNSNSIITTPPPPSTSPGGAGASIKRMDSTCAFITQSTRTRSQSSDSLCSDNSLDSSITSDYNYSTSTKLNEKLTKNDTLTRQQRQQDVTLQETLVRAPTGLKALSVWSNNLTKDSGHHISNLLTAPISLELLNIGKNCLSNDFLLLIKESLMKNSSLTTLGCQSAHLSAKGIETLASILTFGGNSTLQRIDIRDNKLEVESLSTLAEVLQSNTTLTQIDIDDEPKRLSVDSEAYVDYRRILENVRAKCSRNEKTQAKLQTEKLINLDSSGRQHGAYNVGSRKISLTCHSRPLIETCNSNLTPTLPTSAAKLEIKRKSGTRLRSPVPSPPTISPSSSPNRSRFHVVRVQEVSPLTSPQMQSPPSIVSSCSPVNVSNITTMTQTTRTTMTTIPTTSVHYECRVPGNSFPPSNSIPVMTSSTQSIKRMSTSPRSRFHVSKIYEDPKVPLVNRSLPPIMPHINVLSPAITDNVITLASLAEININVPARIETKDTYTSITNINAMHQDSTKTDAEYTTCTPPPCKPSSPPTSLSLTSPVTESNPPLSLSTSPTATSLLLQSTSDSLDGPLEETSTGDTINSTDTITPNSPAMSIVSEAIIKSAAVNTNLLPSGSHSSQNRTRKSPWMGTPPTMDKLLTIFQNFQRSSSPEQKATTNSTSALNSSNSTDSESSLVPTSRSSPLSWSRCGAEILHNSGGNNVDGSTLEQSLSFLDAATKQLRDLSKQVFRSNPYSVNENNSIAMCTTTTTTKQSASVSETTTKSDRSSGGDNDANLNLCTEQEVPHIPKSVKREIKENISPEHTINEETLYSLQKLCTYGNTASSDSCVDTTVSAATDVDNPPVTGVLEDLKNDTSERETVLSSMSKQS